MGSRKTNHAPLQPDTQAELQPDAQAQFQPDAQAQFQPDAQAELQPDAQAELQPVEMPRPGRRRRSAALQPEPLQLDPEFVNNPQRMQYALLLALLLRQKNGSTTFSQRDMAHQDTDYNILFARTLDGRSLEVTVVSSESGIIRSPQKEMEAEKWMREQEAIRQQMTSFQPLPAAQNWPLAINSTTAPVNVLQELARLEASGRSPGGGVPKGTESSPGLYGYGAPGTGFAIPSQGQPQQPMAEVIQLPKREPTATTDGSAAYHFPFQVGESPQDAVGPTTPMDLDHMQRRLLAKDAEVQEQEQEAIARQERGET